MPATETAPLLPPASVDFNKLHADMKAGRTHETALKNAVVAETLVTFGASAAPPAGASDKAAAEEAALAAAGQDEPASTTETAAASA